MTTTITTRVATTSAKALLLTALALCFTLFTPASAQTVGKITIGGKVYGGGKAGAILTSNTSASNTTDAKDVVLTNDDFTADAAQASHVTINASGDDADVQIIAVFGGGEEGRAYGKTNVTINGGTIGATGSAVSSLADDAKAVNGNAFGAGDGQGADVFGGTHLLVTNGTINGSVYGGGNQADLVGSTELTLQGGKYVGAVFGGAKQADIYGRTFVNIDGEHALNDLHIIDVYGGNDIAGTISPADVTAHPNWTWAHPSALATLPFSLASADNLTKKPASVVDGTWNAFILSTESPSKKILIDNLYGGGNGDYGTADADGHYDSGSYAGLTKPVLGKTYIQLQAGMFGSVYGGGNAATVSESTDICLVNGTDLATYLGSPADLNNLSSLLDAKSRSRFSADYQFNRIFGGNNKEPMAIRPNWYLEQGSVNNLYSGGNAGAMTYFRQTSAGGAQSLAGEAGILIHVESDDMTVNNVYGGCRMADVDPGNKKGADMTINAETIDGYAFPRNYAARVLIEGGKINNVYGGNDVSGIVYYGADVEIRSSIINNVYGAGNGSYAYTDNPALKDDPVWGDYYYDGTRYGTSAKSLNIHRPNASTSLVHIVGQDEDHVTYIGGGVYCGGNSATLRADINDHASTDDDLNGATSNLQLGSYVTVDKVFLGSNGENMVKSDTPDDLLQIYKNGPAGYDTAANGPFNSMNLSNTTDFEAYMRGVEVAIHPSVTFDQGYVPHSAKIGSLYGGGNVGSMTAAGTFQLEFLDLIVIYNKLVGGCNNANVAKTDYNAFHLGGLTNDGGLTNGVKVHLDIKGVYFEPRKLTYNAGTHTFDYVWNYAQTIPAVVDVDHPENNREAQNMLIGANIYGGCYASGYINGGVDINISEKAISDKVFTEGQAVTGVTYEDVRDDVLASTLACYGGGYGKETEIWGNVNIDITGRGEIMKAYGGGEMGVVGKLDRNATTGQYLTTIEQEWYPTKVTDEKCSQTIEHASYASKAHPVAKFTDDGIFNATVNLNATLPASSNNVAKLYGGGFQGTISGNTTVNLNRGRVYDAFGGASNADILGHAETYVGKLSAPTVTHNVYGANDFGGLIVGNHLFHVTNSNHEMEKVVAQTYVEYSSGRIGNGTYTGAHYLEGGNLFGGPCGAYKYEDPRYAAATSAEGFCKPQLLKDHLTLEMLTQHSGAGYAANSFVNIISQSTVENDYIEGAIFGAGQGLKGHINSADERGSYVRLAAAMTDQRTVKDLSPRVYGAGYCSNTHRSLVDAYSGRFSTIFGAAHGITYEEVLDLIAHDGTYETNYMGYRSAVRLHTMANRQMDIYGGGANASAQEAGVVLNGGQARNVYGASYDQGITYAASVDVPETSTTKVNAIFGGAKGKGDEFPCDVYNTFVTWNSPNARVNDAIYGGNDAFRMTRNAYVVVNKPVKNYDDKLTNVFGGGFGPQTVTLYTSVSLQSGAQVANVYGGGNNGQVLDTPSFRYYLDDGTKSIGKDTDNNDVFKASADGLKTYPAELLGQDIYGYQKYLNDTEVNGFHEWIMVNYWNDCRTYLDKPVGSYLANDHGHAHDLYFLSTQMPNMKNTNVYIMKDALVAENAYGGGYGADALVSGETSIHLWGGTVKGDIYGGGYGGDVKEYEHIIYGVDAALVNEMTISSTNVDLQGGIVRNVYGGGFNGHVEGKTNVTLGTQDQHPFDFYGTTISGDYEDQVIYGDPIVERSLYGGGQNGHVKGTAYLTINQGHVGYKYDPTVTIETTTDTALRAEYNDAGTSAERKAEILKQICYVENLDLNNEGDNFLDQNGNAFGAGYGEGAYVDVTYVKMYGGTIRNSLYGGGEIAAVGEAVMAQTGAHPEVSSITTPGRTHINMYNGLVQGDVFGGGRGYSYDLTGNEVIGKTLYTDGYVFGTTDVQIHGGTVGTPTTVADGHGNVFGGGNIGYCFTDAHKVGEKGDGNGEGRYYTHEWECDNCGFHDFCYNAPSVCGKCGKSPTTTDAQFYTSFTQVNVSKQILSEDCRVVISPYAQVTAPGGIDILGNNTTLPDGTFLDGSVPTHFEQGDYVPTAYLDLLKDKNTDIAHWSLLSNDGVTIRNAVFAGGNVSAGSDKVYANAITVYGNATASVCDIFFRDLITIGTEHTGGIYGDGNLTFVDGYRELNITNYGTDYYSQQDHITLDEYTKMNDRERAYFELEYLTNANHTYNYYRCTTAHEYNGISYARNQDVTADVYNSFDDSEKSKWASGNKTYSAGDKIKQSDWETMTTEEQDKWEMFGFCSIYAGRLLNTIQRADFCGVFGSRIVLQGAQDRVPEVVDYTQYTINRVGELSLNKKVYEGSNTDGLTPELINHGNYFGMYNIVNYLGALTSDVKFDDIRTTDNQDSGYKDSVDTPSGTKAYGEATYYEWKVAHESDRKRNNGTAHNTVALAAGVYLELVNEPANAMPDPDAPKDYGYITGIVQLDLINVMPGLGGGYVYAKNEHGQRQGNPGVHENLSAYNKNAVNNSLYNYDESNRNHVETSGNFIHNVKQIIDDCYPAGGRYDDYNAAPAHYWYIRGEFYVYDQYISAFTGSSTAYSQNINLPLTITAGANGRLDIIDIKQNLYAYYKEGTTPLDENDAIVVNNITYGLNDVITWWDYMQLNDDQKAHFVPETYVAQMDYCTANNFTEDGKGEPIGIIEKGGVILPSDFADFNAFLNTVVYDPEDITVDDLGYKSMRQITLRDVFHISNAVSHNNGYVLAVNLDNPMVWDNWYSPETGMQKINQEEYSLPSTEKTKYHVGPSYYTDHPGVYGQHQHVLDEIVTQAVVDAYTHIPPKDIADLNAIPGKQQATVAPAYVAVAPVEYDYKGQHKNVQAGLGISLAEYESLSAENKAKFSTAYTCINTYEEDAASGLYIYFGELIPATKYQEFYNQLIQEYKSEHPSDPASLAEGFAKQQMDSHFDKAYIVTAPGLYGGQLFERDTNYRALDTWATLSDEDRQNFQFRYDALDALVFSDLSKQNTNGYFPGTGEEGPGDNNINLYDGNYWDGQNGWPEHNIYGAKQPIDYTATYHGPSDEYLTDGREYNREDYEALPNEKRHYSVFTIEDGDQGKPCYIVKESFISGGNNYPAGRVITKEVYDTFDSTRKNKVQTFIPSTTGNYYICRESYTIDASRGGQNVTDLISTNVYTNGNTVPNGIIINSTEYDNLINKQMTGFTIHGKSPTETTTFYVNRESDIFDLSQDRVVTVIYQYRYEESDESGNNVEEITERHVINIHITFKSGVPTIGRLQDPSIVLPGQTVGLKQPGVTPGAYEILGGGWEIFTNPEDAEKHTNGKTYINNATPMYWYQDGYYVAYFAKTYLGKTYSNSVKFKVANYHDIADVIAHPEFMYVDNPNVHRNSKIYISNDVHEVEVTPADGDTPAVTKTESEIDMLYDLFEASLETSKKTIYVDVQDQEEEDGHPLFWELDGAGKPTSTKTTTDTGYPVHLYWQVDSDGNKDTTKPKTTTITAYPATHSEERIVPKLNDHTRNCANLAFYLSEDVSTAKTGGWEPIGTEPDPTAAPDSPEAEGLCFMGRVHGMGYTINGLQKSLFANLCGYVYNLGVTGSFTRSGVADRVSNGVLPDSDPQETLHGFVTNAWIYTSADITDAIAAEGLDPTNPNEQYLPVVGTPNDLGSGVDGIHTLNCYFPEECGYPMSLYPRGPNVTANSATLLQFNNGEVAYDLNGFYLNKRYSDNVIKTAPDGTTPTTGDNAIIKYWKQLSDGSLEDEPATGYYIGGGSMHAYNGQNLGYVERLFADGDFVYQHGTIPLVINERYSTSESRYLPIWPDDYYFFGQQLTYGYDETDRPYQPLPAHARKTISDDGNGKDNRLVTTEKNNIVYRIPAYFRSNEKKWAHFNPYAVFADKMEPNYTLSLEDQAHGLTDDVVANRNIHSGLTALDFTGHNDFTIWTKEHKFYGAINTDPKLVYSNGSRNTSSLVATYNDDTHDFSPLNDGVYFGPITDYTTIMGFQTFGITQNLLAYAPTQTYSAGTANTRTVLDNYFNEPVYTDHYSADKYRKVEDLDPSSVISSIKGHLIMKENTKADRHYYYAAEDHFLVDKQDFNAPFEYEFRTIKDKNGNDYQPRMWYQRTPDNYADMNKGWEGVSLPFRAELVTTQDKGEITHFYNSALGADYSAGKTSGHEYWLREFTGIATTGTGADDDPEVTTAIMNYPVEEALSTAKSGTNAVTNTFLWDYYYNADGKDANIDDYRHEFDGSHAGDEQDRSRYYYGVDREYDNYPLSVAGRPYIVGFPGGRYYEFDLSGSFTAEHSGTVTPKQLKAQTITFVSDTGITINVSDKELAYDAAGTVTPAGSDYTFYGNYLNVEAAPTLYASAAEYNAAKSTTLTDEQFNALSFAQKKRDDATFNFYVLNADGSAFDATTQTKTTIAAFRPYFASETARLKAPAARSITFGMGNTTQFQPDEETLDDLADHGLTIYAKKRKIVVESRLDAPRTVRITTAAGQVITTYTIQPGERVATPVSEGIYITNLKKLIVE